MWVVSKPERVDELWLDITAQPRQQEHFAVDPAWPPHGHYVVPPEERPAKLAKPPREKYVFPPGHVLSVACPVCGAVPGKVCREMNPLGSRGYEFGEPRCAHDERCRIAWNRVEAVWDEVAGKVKLVEKKPVKVTAVSASQADRIVEEMMHRHKMAATLEGIWSEIEKAREELAAVKARIKFYEEVKTS